MTPIVMSKLPRIKVPVFNTQMVRVHDAIATGKLMTGEDSELFKDKLRDSFGRQFASLTNSGNSALMVSLMAMGISKKKVLIPAVSSCFAIVNAIMSSGNEPFFADVDLNSGNLDISSVERNNGQFDAILSPNFFGILSDVNALKGLGLPIIEDACQSFLTSMGHDSSADALVFSFYPTKVMNAIDGGAVMVSQPQLYQKLEDIIYYDQQDEFDDKVRYNLRMPNLHTSFGLGTYNHLDEIRTQYTKVINAYDRLLDQPYMPERLGDSSNKTLSRYVLRFDSQSKRNSFMSECHSEGIEASTELLGLTSLEGVFPNAKRLIDTTCSLPLHCEISDDDLEYLVIKLESILKSLER